VTPAAFFFLAGTVTGSCALAILVFGLFHILRSTGTLERELVWGIIQACMAAVFLALIIWMFILLARGEAT
jgi:hypothetical protein